MMHGNTKLKYLLVFTTSSVTICEIKHENTKWRRAVIDVLCPTVILSSCALCKCELHSAEGKRAMSTAILVAVVSVDVAQSEYHHHLQRYWLNLADCPWALKHAVYWLCHHRCGASKTSSWYSSSSLETASHRDSSVQLSIISSDIWFGFSRQAYFLTVSKACSFCMAMQCILGM